MAVSIKTCFLPNPDVENPVRNAIEEMFREKDGGWSVSIIGNQANDIWKLVVEGPNGFIWGRDLFGMEHHPQFIVNAIKEAVPQ